MEFETICCIACRRALNLGDIAEGENRCPDCGARFTFHNNIVDFIPEDDFYWGEIDRESLRTINRQIEKSGDWYQAIDEHLGWQPDLVRNIAEPSRLGWLFHCYDANHNRACLDVGSGLGNLSFGLGRFYQQVYSLDGVYDRLAFQALRAKLDGVDHIHFLRSKFLKIPLQDQTMDLVVLNGILEWAGLCDPDQDPRDLQIQFLREIGRVLKPDGKIYLGIENRIGMLYWMGQKDHGGLRFTSLVPRRLADWMVQVSAHRAGQNSANTNPLRFFKPQPGYRFYTYSYWGYQQLFRQAGLSMRSAYWTWPGYSYPRMSGSLDGASIRYTASSISNQLNEGWKRLLMNLLLILPTAGLAGLIKTFAPYFLIVAGHTGRQSSLFQDTILKARPGAPRFVRLSLGVRPRLNTTYLLLDGQGKVTRAIRVKEVSPAVDRRSSFTVHEEPGISGRLIRPHAKDEIELAAHWLADFQQTTTNGVWSSQQLAAEMDMLAGSARLIPGCESLAPRLDQYANLYADRFGGLELSVVSEHGDFTPPNLMISPEHSLCPIDWEFRRAEGNPWMDIGALYLSLLRRVSKRGVFSQLASQQGPVAWFEQAFAEKDRALFFMTPTYYLLRKMKRLQDQQESKPIVRCAVPELLQLVNAALDYSLSYPANLQKQIEK